MIRVIPLGCVLAAAFVAAPTPSARAVAAPVRDVFTPETGLVIQQTSLDLAGAADRLTLLSRIEDAAAAVCQAKPPSGPEPAMTGEQAECRRQAMGRAAWRLHDPALWALAVARIRAIEPRF